MQLEVVAIHVDADGRFSSALGACFGSGKPGWLARDVPGGTSIDFERGRVSSPGGTFLRIGTSANWARAA